MSEITFANVAQKNELVTCAGEVRYLVINEPGRLGHLLQQRFEIVEYEEGKIIGCRQEWRDVPVVDKASSNGGKP